MIERLKNGLEKLESCAVQVMILLSILEKISDSMNDEFSRNFIVYYLFLLSFLLHAIF